MLVGFNVLVILLNYQLRQFGSTSLILGTVALFFVVIAVFYSSLRAKKAAMQASDNQADGIGQPTLLSLGKKPLADQKN